MPRLETPHRYVRQRVLSGVRDLNAGVLGPLEFQDF